MNEINKTLFIPLYGKSMVSKKGIILYDPIAEQIWNEEPFLIYGKSKSKWLAYTMAMRARVFDEWTKKMVLNHPNALVLHIGCGLDSRYNRINIPVFRWIDCDFNDVIDVRKKYFVESEFYSMGKLDATDKNDLISLPDASCVIIILEGISMYLSNEKLKKMFSILKNKYEHLHVLMDVYTVLGAKASKYKNPVNDVGVTKLYGIDNLESLLEGTGITCVGEHSMTPDYLVNELKRSEKKIFQVLCNKKVYQRFYRLFELE